MVGMDGVPVAAGSVVGGNFVGRNHRQFTGARRTSGRDERSNQSVDATGGCCDGSPDLGDGSHRLALIFAAVVAPGGRKLSRRRVQLHSAKPSEGSVAE